MKKKVKKIPKYNAGGSVLDTLLNNNQLITPAFNSQNNGVSSATAGTVAAGKTWSDMNNTQRTSAIVDAAGVVLNGIGNIGKPATLSGAIQGGLSGASTGAAIGGPLGAGIGFAAGTLFNSIGNKASTDGYGNYKKSTGITRLLGIGKSDSEIRQQANREKNAMISQQQTQAMQSDYYNENPAGSINVLAAEGGIMRKPVDALVSKGELIYDPTTKKLRQVPGSKGKPNKADDVYAKLYEGDVVISNSPTMLMANGKTPAQNLMGMVDKYATGGTVKAREAIIKKVVNWQEANKTKPQEYAKFDEGDPGFFSYLMSNRTRPIDAVISEYMKSYGKTAKEFKGFDGSDKSFLQGLQNIINANDEYVLPIRFTGGKSFDQVRSMPISSAVEFNPEYWDYYNQQSKPNNTSNANVVKPTKPLWQPTENIGITTHPEIDNVWSRHKTSDFVAAETPVTTVPTVSKKKQETVTSKKGTVNKPSSGKKTTAVSQDTTPAQINQTQLDWARQEAAKAMSQYAPNTTRPIAPGLVAPKIDPTETVEEAALPGSGTAVANGSQGSGSNGSDWKDNLYRMAVLSQPLWDRAKAESVDYTSPVYKYMPTAVDVSSQLRDADQSYALSRYNFANLYPNTGAGMAAGLQAASNRAKQYADIRQWQTNAQNELIGKNVGIYNNWANEHARIMNDVYNKTAQNRATARNINRQNRTAWLSNWGTILRDDRQFAADSQNKELQTEALKPLIQSVYENSDTLMPMLAQYTANKDIKKKSATR